MVIILNAIARFLGKDGDSKASLIAKLQEKSTAIEEMELANLMSFLECKSEMFELKARAKYLESQNTILKDKLAQLENDSKCQAKNTKPLHC